MNPNFFLRLSHSQEQHWRRILLMEPSVNAIERLWKK